MAYDQSLKATELRLGLPGTHENDDNDNKSSNNSINNKKRQLSSSLEMVNRDLQDQKVNKSDDHIQEEEEEEETPPPAKAQIVGWPPVRGYRKNSLMMSQQKKISNNNVINNNNNNNNSEAEISGMFMKVSMDGAPYLRKIDIRVYKNYTQLLKALESMFKFTLGEYSEREGYKGSDFVPTYEDKDGDWMLVGDVPWDMFMSSCKRMRIMKESEARGLGCGA